MTLQELKNAIETKSLSNELLIFKSSNPFLTNHYIDQIAKLRGVEINYIDDLHFDNSPLKRFTFDDYAVKLTTLIKNKIPIINTTINLSSLSKDVLNSLK